MEAWSSFTASDLGPNSEFSHANTACEALAGQSASTGFSFPFFHLYLSHVISLITENYQKHKYNFPAKYGVDTVIIIQVENRASTSAQVRSPCVSPHTLPPPCTRVHQGPSPTPLLSGSSPPLLWPPSHNVTVSSFSRSLPIFIGDLLLRLLPTSFSGAVQGGPGGRPEHCEVPCGFPYSPVCGRGPLHCAQHPAGL